MEIAEQLLLLKNIKDNIKAAIVGKGGIIANNTPFSDYARIIQTLSGGGGKHFLKRIDKSFVNAISSVSGKPYYNDYIVIGSLTNNNGVYSGFSSNNYIEVPIELNLSTADSWEIGCKFTTGSNISSNQTIIGAARSTSQGNSCGTCIDIYNGNLRFYTPLASNNNPVVVEASMSVNTTYEVRGIFTGTQYQVYVNNVLVNSITESRKALYNSNYNDKFYIGQYRDRSDAYLPFLGQNIDVNSCYIKINGENYWYVHQVEEQNL